jgi:hypothetical protein
LRHESDLRPHDSPLRHYPLQFIVALPFSLHSMMTVYRGAQSGGQPRPHPRAIALQTAAPSLHTGSTERHASGGPGARRPEFIEQAAQVLPTGIALSPPIVFCIKI